jgi:hypothetical protein
VISIGFGMNTKRVNIHKAYSCEYFYITKEINNQYERKFLKWNYINNLVKETENNKEIDIGQGMSNI